jgi:glycosyltransferase involved in cell wall biosynthesis
MLAAQRPVIAADSAANRELLTHGESALLAPPGDPAALAAAILHLHLDAPLRRRIAEQGRSRYLCRASERVITGDLRVAVERALAHWAASNSSR